MTEPEQPAQPDPESGDDRDLIDAESDVVDPDEFPLSDSSA